MGHSRKAELGSCRCYRDEVDRLVVEDLTGQHKGLRAGLCDGVVCQVRFVILSTHCDGGDMGS